ncbi:hypothetical protein DL93DRAFT_2091168 [Clavulina sp. PMI_390]|nr:hypothetical protein DL93DRAFT_2091168 [Clavulina sp. PMI_390]
MATASAYFKATAAGGGGLHWGCRRGRLTRSTSRDVFASKSLRSAVSASEPHASSLTTRNQVVLCTLMSRILTSTCDEATTCTVMQGQKKSYFGD